jgi:hypothetical protein
LRDLFDIFGVYLAEFLPRIFGIARALIFGSLYRADKRNLKRWRDPQMMANNLSDLPLKYNTIRPNNHADGFGFGGEVRIEEGGDRLGSLGDFGWYGLAMFCKINRTEGVVALCLTQHLPIDWHSFECFLTFITKLWSRECRTLTIWFKTPGIGQNRAAWAAFSQA